MQWEYSKQGDCTGRAAPGYPRFEAMKELCAHVAEYVIPNNRDVKWEYLRVEVWSDSGQVIVFPSANVEFFRIEKVGCQLVFEELLQWFDEALVDRDGEEVDRLIDQKEREWGDLFLVAAEASPLRGTRVLVYSADGDLFRDRTLQADFRALPTEGLCFDDADLSGADFTDAGLYWASFFQANLTQANLSGADLRGADLKEACLREASLENANADRDTLTLPTRFDGADLCGADLTGMRFEGAVFTGALYNSLTRFPAGFNPKGQGMIKHA